MRDQNVLPYCKSYYCIRNNSNRGTVKIKENTQLMLQRFLPIRLESNYPDILDLGETNLEDFNNFLVSNYLPLV